MIMNNNDRLSRLRYSLDIKDPDMVTIFDLGGVQISQDQVKALLTKVQAKSVTGDQGDTEAAVADRQAVKENIYQLACSDQQFERFLNGLITSQRGKKDGPEPRLELNEANANNLFLKKVKIALTLTSDDILEIMAAAGLEISNSELSAVLRKEGHRNYKACGDRYIRYFLRGLAKEYRND